MKIKKKINIFIISILCCLPLSGTHAQDLDVQQVLQKAENNDKQGLYQLAYLKQKGEQGIEKNIPEAIELYKRASALGHRSANHNLGLIYYRGDSVPVDYVESAKWLSIASERNLEDSQRILLTMFYSELIPKNISLMEKLHLQLASKGEQEDIEQLVDFYYFHKEDMASAEKYALQLAEQGNAEYQYTLGAIYAKPMNGKRNFEKAFPWFLKAAEANNFNGKMGLASLYLGGLGVPQNIEKAKAWFESAYEQDPVKACEIHSMVISKLNNEIRQCQLSTR